MKRLNTSLKGITHSFVFNQQDERFFAVVTDHYNSSGHHFMARLINP
jgi:hypothetical protein